MKTKRLIIAIAVAGIAICASLLVAASAARQSATSARTLPLQLDTNIVLDIQSTGVDWKGQTFHLLRLGDINFTFDKQTSCLKADIRTETASFDDVTYDVSAAVLDAQGELLGTARAQCKIERVWVGNILHSTQTITLDFGVSLDYTQASTFMVSVSKRKVLTPDEWRKGPAA